MNHFELREKFLNKVCTILCHQTSYPFKDGIEYSEFFTGLIEDIDESGVWLRHLKVKTLAFFAFPIVGIVEEQVLQKGDPIIEKIKESNKPKPIMKPPIIGQTTFVPVESLTKLVRDAKDKN